MSEPARQSCQSTNSMKTLLVYATNSSGTFQASQVIRERLEQAGHAVTLRAAQETQPADLKKFPVVILGSCTWELFVDGQRLEGQLQEKMHALVHSAHDLKLPKTTFAVFGLGDRSYTDFCQAADLLEAFVHDIGAKCIVPTLRIDSWFFEIHRNRQAAAEWAEQLATKLA